MKRPIFSLVGLWLAILLVLSSTLQVHAQAPAEDRPDSTLTIAAGVFQVQRNARRDGWNATFDLGSEGGAGLQDPLDVVFAYQSPESYSLLTLRPENGHIRFNLVEHTPAGQTAIASGQAPLPEGSPAQHLQLRRRALTLSAYLDHRQLFRIGNRSKGRGTIATRSESTQPLPGADFQPIAEADMRFDDTFMRFEGDASPGTWQRSSGSWRLQSFADKWRGESPQDVQNAARNANPFVYRGQGTPEAPAIVLAGQPFWDDLSGSVAVRSHGGRCGWIFGYRDPTAYHVLWWEPADTPDAPARLALERVAGSARHILAETWIRARRDQWYRIGAESRGSAIAVIFQGFPLLHVVDDSFSGGRFGLVTDGAADFDDVTVTPAPCRPMQETWFQEQCTLEPPQRWQTTETGLSCAPASMFTRHAGITFPSCLPFVQRLGFTLDIPEQAPAKMTLVLALEQGGKVSIEVDSAEKRNPHIRAGAEPAAGPPLEGEARGGFNAASTTRYMLETSAYGLNLIDVAKGLQLHLPGLCEPVALSRIDLSGSGGVTLRDLVLDGPDERSWEKPVRNEIFVKDHYMLDWAAPSGQWTPDPVNDNHVPRWWHNGDFFGSVYLGIPAAAIASPPGIRVLFPAPESSDTAGYSIVIGPRQGSTPPVLTAALYHGDEPLARSDIPMPDPYEAVDVIRDGSFIALRCAGQQPLFVQLPNDAPSGTRLGLQLPNADWLPQIALRRDCVIDDQFDQVPTAWHTFGRWEVSNKFDCDPRWAYLVGESDGLASIWHQDAFPGDVTLEFYAGMRYRAEYNFMPYYPRPGDINASLSPEVGNVFAGYTAIISGWHTTWSRLLREGAVQAETAQPLVPSTRERYAKPQDLHRKWFYVKLRRRDNRLQVYFDNEPVLDLEDAAPLATPRLGLWTVDNSIVVARAKISYAQRQRRPPRLLPAPDTPPAPVADPLPRLRSATHPGVDISFNHPEDLSVWGQKNQPDDAQLQHASSGGPDGSGCLLATNPNHGGLFRVPLPLTGLELRRAEELAFDCRLDPGVQVNLYATLGSRAWFVQLTGPGESSDLLTRLAAADIKADGQWHRVSIPLGRLLGREHPLGGSLALTDLYLGVGHPGYIRAGLDANPKGARLWLDNLQLRSYGANPVLLSMTPPAATDTLAIVPLDRPAAEPLPFTLDAPMTLPPGTYQVRTTTAAATAPTAPRFTFSVTAAYPPVDTITPAAGAEWGSEPIRIRFAAEPPLPTWETRLTIGAARFSVDGRILSWDAESHTLVFDPNAARLSLKDGESSQFALSMGRGDTAATTTWSLTYRSNLDAVPPGPVRLKQVLLADAFEETIGTWRTPPPDRQGRQHGALLRRDAQHAASGSHSLKLINPLVGGNAGAEAGLAAFNAGKHPLLFFDCRMEEKMLLDLHFTAGGEPCRVTLTDNAHRNHTRRLGSVSPAFRADGTWQRLEVNLRDLLAAAPFRGRRFAVDRLAFADGGWTGNPAGAAMWIDTVTLVPTLSSAGEGLEITWDCHDPGGIRAVSCHWSTEANEDADQEADVVGNSTRFKNLPEGRLVFHIRAVDTAGNWGPTSHWTCLIDNTPPQVADVYPEAGTRSGSRVIRIRFHDPISGIDPDTLAMAVNGRTFKPGHQALSLDLESGTMELDWVRAGIPLPEGTDAGFSIQVPTLRDFAGNLAPATSWSWTFDSAADRTPPAAPRVRWQGGRTAKQITFDTGSPTLTTGAGLDSEQLFDPQQGSQVLQASVSSEAAEISAVITSSLHTKTYPFLSFRYRFPPQLMLDLVGRLDHSDRNLYWMVVKLTEGDVRPDYATLAGWGGDIRCDDTWHTAFIDLREHMSAWDCLDPGAQPTTWSLKSLAFQDLGFNWNELGTTFRLDDIVVFGAGPKEAAFVLAAEDESGIAGFACSVDQVADSTPADTINVKPGDPFRTAFAEPGLWYVHVRAVDGAGNWSNTTHLPYVFE